MNGQKTEKRVADMMKTITKESAPWQGTHGLTYTIRPHDGYATVDYDFGGGFTVIGKEKIDYRQAEKMSDEELKISLMQKTGRELLTNDFHRPENGDGAEISAFKVLTVLKRGLGTEFINNAERLTELAEREREAERKQTTQKTEAEENRRFEQVNRKLHYEDGNKKIEVRKFSELEPYVKECLLNEPDFGEKAGDNSKFLLVTDKLIGRTHPDVMLFTDSAVQDIREEFDNEPEFAEFCNGLKGTEKEQLKDAPAEPNPEDTEALLCDRLERYLEDHNIKSDSYARAGFSIDRKEKCLHYYIETREYTSFERKIPLEKLCGKREDQLKKILTEETVKPLMEYSAEKETAKYRRIHPMQKQTGRVEKEFRNAEDNFHQEAVILKNKLGFDKKQVTTQFNQLMKDYGFVTNDKASVTAANASIRAEADAYFPVMYSIEGVRDEIPFGELADKSDAEVRKTLSRNIMKTLAEFNAEKALKEWDSRPIYQMTTERHEEFRKALKEDEKIFRITCKKMKQEITETPERNEKLTTPPKIRKARREMAQKQPELN